MLSRFAKSLQHQPYRLTLVVMVAFVAYAFFPAMTMFGEMPRLNSPDETINWTTALRVADGRGVGVYEPLNAVAENIIRPRAMTVIGEYIVPVSFLAMPVMYGAIGAVTSSLVIPFLTALVTALVLPMVYGVWRRYFGERVALIATVVWAFHPAVWYYASRGMYHNVLFVDLLIVAWWVYLVAKEKKWHLDWVLALTLVISLAIAVRLNELVWILPVLLVAWWSNRQDLRWKHYVTGCVVVGVFWVGWYWLQQSVYGGASVQYTTPTQSTYWIKQWLLLIWPFGFDVGTLSLNVQRYLLILGLPMWLMVWVWLVVRWQTLSDDLREFKNKYLILTLFVTCWLLLYYGSWGVVDTVGESGVTVGNSHVRYWLPVYFVWMPYVALGIDTVSRWFRVEHKRIITVSIVMFMVCYGFLVTFFDKYEGLTAIAARLQDSRATAMLISEVTSPDAVIIGDRSDKLFFPDRRVISPGTLPYYMYDELWRALPVLMNKAPVYVYGLGIIDNEVMSKFGELGIIFDQPIALPDGGWLYPLIQL